MKLEKRGQCFHAFVNSVAYNKKHQSTKTEAPLDGVNELMFVEVRLLFHQAPKRKCRVLPSLPRGSLQIVKMPPSNRARIVECLRNDFATRLWIADELAFAEYQTAFRRNPNV